METYMSAPKIQVLVVDDDPTFREGLRVSLNTTGYCTGTRRNGEEAIEYIHANPVDIVLLDINMPGIGGVEACRRIRAAAPPVGIVMLTVRDTEGDKVMALEAGADDYVTKPFHLRELVARIRAVLRRTGAEPRPETPTLRAGDLELELGHRTVRKAGQEIHLTPKEFEMLAFLMQHQDVPVTHAKILRAVWGPAYSGQREYLRSYVKTLRKKIEDDPAHPQYILREPWVGYRFRDPSNPDAVAPSPDEEDADSD
jgi:two-component system, OmpR family, KDP operon response regulator KdpE